MPRRGTSTNVFPFPSPIPEKSQPYALDVISFSVVNGMVLIEGCVPVAALDAIRTLLDTY